MCLPTEYIGVWGTSLKVIQNFDWKWMIWEFPFKTQRNMYKRFKVLPFSNLKTIKKLKVNDTYDTFLLFIKIKVNIKNIIISLKKLYINV